MDNVDNNAMGAKARAKRCVAVFRQNAFQSVAFSYRLASRIANSLKAFARKASFLLTTTTTILISVSIVYWSDSTHAVWAKTIWTDFDQTSFGLAIGALSATILALVYSLSIIPAQRAADIFSPSVLHLYGRDPVVIFVFVILSACILTTILSGTGWSFGLPSKYVFVIQFSVLGIAIDGIRTFYQRALRLLDPNYAADRLTAEILKLVGRAERVVRIMAAISRIPIQNAQEDFDNDARLALIYRARPDLIRPINTGVEELSEIASKAIQRREHRTVATVVRSLVSIATGYMASRRQSDVFSLAAPEMVFSSLASETDQVTHPIYEHLSSINSEAVSASLEQTSMNVIRGLGSISIHNLRTSTPANGVPSPSFAYVPFYYLKECAVAAGANKMDDAVLTAVRQSLAVYGSITPGVNAEDIELEIMASLHTFASDGYLRRSEVVATEATKGLLSIGYQSVSNDQYQGTTILNYVLDYIEALVPYAIITQSAGGHTISNPFPAYTELNQSSLIAIMKEATKHLREYDPDRQWIDLHGDFIEIADVAYRHLRKVADNNEFGSCFILHDLINTISEAVSTFIYFYSKNFDDDYYVSDGLENKLIWFIHLYCWFFSDKKDVNKLWANDASRSLAYFAVWFLDNDKPHLAIECSKCIRSIANSVYASDAGNAPYTIADILVEVWTIRLAIEVKEPSLLDTVDGLLGPLDEGNGAPWEQVTEALEIRKGQLDDKLTEYGYRQFQRYDPVPELRRIREQAEAEGPES